MDAMGRCEKCGVALGTAGDLGHCCGEASGFLFSPLMRTPSAPPRSALPPVRLDLAKLGRGELAARVTRAREMLEGYESGYFLKTSRENFNEMISTLLEIERRFAEGHRER